MHLRRQHHFCVWCGRDFELVSRSLEHLIPASLFGDVTTDDVCKPCNDRFGSELDHVFLSDPATVSVALEAGVEPSDLLANYRATQPGPDGLMFETSVRRGTSAVVPQMNRDDGPLIGDRAGRLDSDQLRGMTRRTVASANRRRPDLGEAEVKRRVEALYSKFLADETLVEVRDDEIGEGLRRIVVESRPTIVGLHADPALVARAVGKIMYETMQSLVPFQLRVVMRAELSAFKEFVRGRNEGVGFIGNRCLDGKPVRSHSILISVVDDCLTCSVIFFGKLEWMFSARFQDRSGRPAQVPPFEEVIHINF